MTTTEMRDELKDVGTSMEIGRQLWPARRGLMTLFGSARALICINAIQR